MRQSCSLKPNFLPVAAVSTVAACTILFWADIFADPKPGCLFDLYLSRVPNMTAMTKPAWYESGL